ncbi:MarR family winged helix-turn-helix transcriptional regulator [Agromyces aureus]|uniref:MarR family transcriptional regulator n=1 Tax=Agromyces aureus TaxID=453304 RepID=A0A191WGD8_9MICO|nr:MarR family transcriptional regulator [Agromyces aureus]ANJ27321.1 MarR family transcriptional regulator [Agromyces aureus]
MAVTYRVATKSSEAEALLLDLVNAYEHAFERAAETVALSAAQACVLGRLSEHRPMGALAEELGCDASNISQIVGRLEGLGLAYRETAPDDRRVRVVSRTTTGHQVSQRFERSFSFARDALARLSGEEQDLLTSLLHKALGSAPAEHDLSDVDPPED